MFKFNLVILKYFKPLGVPQAYSRSKGFLGVKRFRNIGLESRTVFDNQGSMDLLGFLKGIKILGIFLAFYITTNF